MKSTDAACQDIKLGSYSKEALAVNEHKLHLTRHVENAEYFSSTYGKIKLIANSVVIFNGDLCFGSI